MRQSLSGEATTWVDRAVDRYTRAAKRPTLAGAVVYALTQLAHSDRKGARPILDEIMRHRGMPDPAVLAEKLFHAEQEIDRLAAALQQAQESRDGLEPIRQGTMELNRRIDACHRTLDTVEQRMAILRRHPQSGEAPLLGLIVELERSA